MLYLLIFGVIALIWPGWFMAVIGMGSRLEEEACLVWFFRILGAVLIVAAIWYWVAYAFARGHQ